VEVDLKLNSVVTLC